MFQSSLVTFVIGIICLFGFTISTKKVWSYLLIALGVLTLVGAVTSAPLGIPLMVAGAFFMILGLFGSEAISVAKFQNSRQARLALSALTTVAFLGTATVVSYKYYNNHSVASAKTSTTTKASADDLAETKTTVYKTSHVKLVSTSDLVHQNDWVVKGTTKAPDSSKVVAVILDEDSNAITNINLAESKNIHWVTVKNGRFKAYINTLEAFDSSSKRKANETQEVYLVALSNYHKKDTTIIPKSIRKDIQETAPYKISLSSEQADYLNSLGNSEKSSDDDSTNTSNSADSDDTTDSDDDETEPTSDADADDTDETGSSSTSSSTTGTAEERAALNTATDYASEMDMSKQGVYDQLVSSSGEGFTTEASQYAIDHLSGINWNANALATAKSYQKDMDMSQNEIMDQLTSKDGEQFTQSEAQYAIDHLSD